MKMYTIYWLINEKRDKTYVGFSDNLERRLLEHRLGRVKSTKDSGRFVYLVVERVFSLMKARERERYWKSAAGRKKLKVLFKQKVMASSSSG